MQYEDVYPGIDLIYYGDQRHLEYDLAVEPGADPKAITLALRGADKLVLDASGDLVVHAAGVQIRMHKPLIYQEAAGRQRFGVLQSKDCGRRLVSARPKIKNNLVLAYESFS